MHRALVLERGIRRGSSWPVVMRTSGGRFLTKLRGAGHGTAALVAEWIVAELASVLGLAVPARALIEIDDTLVREDRDGELAELIRASHGVNLGFELLEGARELDEARLAKVDEDLASRIVWLDALVENVDRTPKNPNLLEHAGRIWLIDHGSALVFHHDWPRVTEQTPREHVALDHVLALRATRVRAVDGELADKLTREVLDKSVDSIPAAFLDATDEAQRFRLRRAYSAYLYKRLRPPRVFV